MYFANKIFGRCSQGMRQTTTTHHLQIDYEILRMRRLHCKLIQVIIDRNMDAEGDRNLGLNY